MQSYRFENVYIKSVSAVAGPKEKDGPCGKLFDKTYTSLYAGTIIRAEETSTDMYVSIDLVEEVIERQLRKYKNKLIQKEQNVAQFSKGFVDEDTYDEEEISIIRSKKFAMKPMDPEEACVQMELLGHTFFVFRNSETDEVNVVYKRKDNTYGLIEPEF